MLKLIHWENTSHLERLMKHARTCTHTPWGLFTLACHTARGPVKMRPHQPAIRNQWNQWQTGGEEQRLSLSAACLFCSAFCLSFSSLGNKQSEPEHQMSVKSHRSNTLGALFMQNQGPRCCCRMRVERLEQGVSGWGSIVSLTRACVEGNEETEPLKLLCWHRGAICCHEAVVKRRR